ncbi:MAG: tetratricopeptide repeat protein [Candidatus Zixiibacteriota bacterium]
MRKIKIAIVAALIVVFACPLVQAQENKELWSASTYIQSAKIHYKHVYVPSKERKELYHCIDLLKEGAGKFGHMPEFYYMIGTFYAEIYAIDTVVAYFDSVAIYCADETIDEKYRRNCYKKEDYIKKMEKQRLAFWEKSYNSAIGYIDEFDQVTDMKTNSPEDSISIYDSLATKAFDLAMSDFNMALMARPGDTTTLMGTAALYQRQNMHKEAIDLYNQIKEIKGENCDITSRIAYAYISMEDWQNSIVWFEKLVNCIPDDINSLINLSVSYYQLKDYDKWYETTEKVISFDPENPQFLFNAAQYWWYNKRNDYTEQLSEIDKNATDAAAQEEELEAKINECAVKTTEYLEKMLKVHPNDCDASRILGFAYILLSDYPKVIESFSNYIDNCDLDEDLLDILGQAYYREGDLENAIKTYEKLVETNPGSEVGWESLGTLYDANKMPEKAKEATAKAEELKKL